ncbi:Utp14-domain-containing protein [Coemansia reversa NRRL 1564]|uniref:Utp14-domain-containing protein n=1 Tax=Coemansia reversa (strain ATCC 12441 / NRRL 1564) TaxID=763665 RepID=A0A2G5BHT5_COERN|nr:Utp14-domain-containing protein [Coemansia reversa NRRL 1564]|eukprot:PIA18297.1 Utp14-domain-containing protein [Coemansia reversa NRRL 1564]
MSLRRLKQMLTRTAGLSRLTDQQLRLLPPLISLSKVQKRAQDDPSFLGNDAALQDHTEVSSVNDQTTKRVRLNDAGQVTQVSSGGGHLVRLSGPMSIDAVANTSTRHVNDMDADMDSVQNPWLDDTVTAASNRRSANSKQLSKESTKLDKLSAKLREKRHDAASDKAESSQNVLLDMSKTLLLAKAQVNNDDEPTSDEEGIKLEHVDARSNAEKKLKAKTFTQRELVEQAFAEDDVVDAEFAAEKEAEMELDAPKTEDLTVPGWGSWGGAGIQQKKNKIIRKPVPGSGVEKSNRQDAKMGSVIINHRQLKTANKYYANNVPFPFSTSEQYEATMRMPLGKEWNTTKSYSKMIKPRVMTKAGRIIDPFSIPSKKRQ